MLHPRDSDSGVWDVALRREPRTTPSSLHIVRSHRAVARPAAQVDDQTGHWPLVCMGDTGASPLRPKHVRERVLGTSRQRGGCPLGARRTSERMPRLGQSPLLGEGQARPVQGRTSIVTMRCCMCSRFVSIGFVAKRFQAHNIASASSR